MIRSMNDEFAPLVLLGSQIDSKVYKWKITFECVSVEKLIFIHVKLDMKTRKQ